MSLQACEIYSEMTLEKLSDLKAEKADSLISYDLWPVNASREMLQPVRGKEKRYLLNPREAALYTLCSLCAEKVLHSTCHMWEEKSEENRK